MAVREVAAVVKAQRKHRVAGRQEREVRGHVGLRAGVRLDIGVLGAVQALRALDGQRLDLVDDVAAAVVALARIALGVLVGGDAADRLHDRRPREVLRGDQLELVALAVQLAVEKGRDRGIDCFESSGAEGVEGEIVDGHAAECTRGVGSGKQHRRLSMRCGSVQAAHGAGGACRKPRVERRPPHVPKGSDPLGASSNAIGLGSSVRAMRQEGLTPLEHAPSLL